MANCLLYCVRYDDTLVWTNTEDHSSRIIVVNIKHIPYVTSPLANLMNGDLKIPCEKIAIVYRKPIQYSWQIGQKNETEVIRQFARTVEQKLSKSFLVENSLLQHINLIAAIPSV